ncbi:uncharacterized protein LOC112454641 [Temnothorax curvispinosus]|uniref:Uncharacterized protein LOC112454641 n=1 Tax=Temnothorax curvispinosus TaxID=300111 RepID=A0A6J1PQB5_9HYME|nr:uncharacterized protein LOC112454641 [Temnothorax curvispinosus]
MTEEITIDEVIINIVRDHKFVYDKMDVNYKNGNKKKNVWKTIAFQLKEVYNVNMSAENIEKRWSALRDMFGREERRRKLAPSGSGRSESKEWHLYRPLLFLSSHIAHRKTQELLIRKPSEDSRFQPVRFQQACSQPVEPSKEQEATVEEEILQEIWNSSEIDHTCDESQMMDNDAQSLPESVTRQSSCSSSSSQLHNFNFKSTTSRALISKMKPTRTIVPPMDDFANRKNMKNALLDEHLVEAVLDQIPASFSEPNGQVCEEDKWRVLEARRKDGSRFKVKMEQKTRQ